MRHLLARIFFLWMTMLARTWRELSFDIWNKLVYDFFRGQSRLESNRALLGFSWQKSETSPTPTGDVEWLKSGSGGRMCSNTSRLHCHSHSKCAKSFNSLRSRNFIPKKSRVEQQNFYFYFLLYIQADSRNPFIRNFLISPNHIKMKIGKVSRGNCDIVFQ
jgi:hypothetical protein